MAAFIRIARDSTGYCPPYLTTKFLLLVSVPLGVVTTTGPMVVPQGTSAIRAVGYAFVVPALRKVREGRGTRRMHEPGFFRDIVAVDAAK